ncbi:MAG TPA: response regulator [Planctomycetota bacterium]|jgi:DNA-binding response OmpR family regulator|nr:response regulator [Planctomycetota bacterium]
MSRILVVDDDDAFRAMLRETLERAGHEVHDAPNGAIALEIDQRTPCDVVVIDLVMPEKEGLETILELRRRRSRTKIIAMSGGGSGNPQSNLAIAARLGARRTLTKPFSRGELLLAVDHVLVDATS